MVKIVDNLYQSPLVEKWDDILNNGINVVINLSENLAVGVPTSITYIYWAIEDGPLPDTNILWSIAIFGAQMIKNGYKVLSYCISGYNRSSLMNACILKKLNPILRGEEIIALIRKARPGALSNPTFFDFIKRL